MVRLINDYGDEYPFYDIRNYNRFIEKYHPKFSLPALSPTIPFKTSSLQTYENYLRLHLGVLVNIKAAFDEVKTYSELCELLAVLPDNYYPKLTFQQRLNSLKILATEGLAVVSWRGWLENGGTEGIALKLLFTTPEPERSKMLDSLVAGPAINGRVHLLAALCGDISGLDGDNFNRFIGDITRWIFEYRQSAEENLVKSVAEGRYVIFDPDFWGDGIQYKFDSKGDIVFLIFKKSSQKVLREYLHPYDWINIQFTSATQYLGKPIPKGSTLRLPALFVYGVFNHIDRDRMGTALETTLDVALMAVGVGEIALALKAANGIRKAYLVTKSIVDLTAGMGDLVVSNVLAEKLNETDAGREFLNSWNTFQLYYGLGSLGVSGGEALVKQLRKQGDDLTQTAGNLSHTEKDEVEKIVADVERKVSGAGSWITVIGRNIDELAAAPLGYQFFIRNDQKFIRRLNSLDPNTPQLTVRYGKVFQATGKVLTDANEIKLLLKLDANKAYFWSGRTSKGEGVMDMALSIAQMKGGSTLEGLLDKYKILMPEWNANIPSVVKLWEDVSALFANQVSGEVRAVLGKNLRPGNIWETVELPRLKKNPNVNKIYTIDPETNIELLLWKR